MKNIDCGRWHIRRHHPREYKIAHTFEDLLWKMDIGYFDHLLAIKFDNKEN